MTSLEAQFRQRHADILNRRQHGKFIELVLSYAVSNRNDGWTPLYPDILGLNISQYGRVIKECRSAGIRIVNRTERQGTKRVSWFRLELEPVQHEERPADTKPRLLFSSSGSNLAFETGRVR